MNEIKIARPDFPAELMSKLALDGSVVNSDSGAAGAGLQLPPTAIPRPTEESPGLTLASLSLGQAAAGAGEGELRVTAAHTAAPPVEGLKNFRVE